MELGGTFPEALVILKIPSGLFSVNLNPSAVPSLWIVNKFTPLLSVTCNTPAEAVEKVSLSEPWNSPAPGLVRSLSLACAAVSLPSAV